MISVRPDPAHPRGGYAELSLPADAVQGDETQVAVFDNYKEQYLGEAGWQPTREMFGPYAVVRDGDQARVIVGPEIVNQMPEYANVKLTVGTVEDVLSWPDEVVPAPGAAKIGGIMGATLKEQVTKGTLTARMPEPPPAEIDPVIVADPIPQAVAPEPPTLPEAKGKGGLMVGLLLLALAVAGVAYWFMTQQEEAPVAVAPPAPVAAVEPSDTCGIAYLDALPDFATAATALRGCGAQVSADTALLLVERAAAAGTAEALLLFGTVYDGAASDAVIEDQIGLTFGDVPATAAEYYARAVTAGSAQAADNLAALCERMSAMTDTLVQGAVTDYCGN